MSVTIGMAWECNNVRNDLGMRLGMKLSVHSEL